MVRNRFKSLFLLFALLLFFPLAMTTATKAAQSTRSLRFSGGNESRVTIPVTNSSINIGAGNFTLEFWIKPVSVPSSGANCSNGEDVFTDGGLIIDRDQWGPGNYGDFGISIMKDRKLAFSVHNGSMGVTACSAALSLNTWYYIAAVKSGNTISIYVNGTLSQSRTFSGNTNLSYNFSHTYNPSCPSPCQDPTLVLGAEKHRVGYNFNGFIDELRISNTARSISARTTPFDSDGNTVALYRFENNTQSATGAYHGTQGSVSYANDVPFANITTPTASPLPTQTQAPTQPAQTQKPSPTPSPSPKPTTQNSGQTQVPPGKTPTPTPISSVQDPQISPLPTENETPITEPSSTPITDETSKEEISEASDQKDLSKKEVKKRSMVPLIIGLIMSVLAATAFLLFILLMVKRRRKK